MSIINNDLLLGSGDEGYNLTRSLRFRSSANAYLKRTLTGVSITKLSYSVWTKRGALGSDYTIQGSLNNVSNYFLLGFNSSDQLDFQIGGTANRRKTTQVFRDPSAWYHIYLVLDTTQATADNRIKMYVNGVQVTAFATNTTGVAQNANLPALSTTMEHDIGGYNAATAGWFYDGYFADYYYLEGQALDVTSFGSTNATTGVWQPIRYAGTFTGTNSCYLPFTDNSALTTSSNVGLGKDFSGNGNYWTTNNISITAGVTYDSMTDVPTLTSATAANFAVLNPIDASSNGTLSRANLQSTSVGVVSGKGSIAVSSGKWYWEVTCTGGDYSGVGSHIGIDSVITPCTSAASARIGSTATSYSYNSWNGQKQNNNTSSAYGNTYTTNDVISIALDLDSGKIWWAKNGTWQASGDPAAGTNAAFSSITSGLYTAACGDDTGGGIVLNYNFGQRPFAYTPPTGFVALNTYNLPTSTIVKGNTVMDATLYSGNGTTTGNTQVITNTAGFKPDLVWIKARNSATPFHILNDSVRGTNKILYSNSTDVENSVSNVFNSFNSNGFTVDYNSGFSQTVTNANGQTYVGWQWQAGQGTTSTNTSGTITSTVSVNASAGFSVVTYTGTGASATVGHGLGVAPQLIIGRSRTNAFNWGVWQKSLQTLYGDNAWLRLNTSDAYITSFDVFDPQNNTSSVFGIGSEATMNASGSNFVAYCWTPIAGYSAFGSYTGNGSSDGTFVFTGFQPKWVMIKRTDSGNNWFVLDTARNTYNLSNAQLLPNSSAAESTNTDCNIDILSNGFKLRTALDASNGSGGTYIYAAFAANPFKNSLAR